MLELKHFTIWGRCCAIFISNSEFKKITNWGMRASKQLFLSRSEWLWLQKEHTSHKELEKEGNKHLKWKSSGCCERNTLDSKNRKQER